MELCDHIQPRIVVRARQNFNDGFLSRQMKVALFWGQEDFVPVYEELLRVVTTAL